jgi:CshA-type fibril repeat protein
VSGQGSYVVDPITGLVTFDPLSTFSGTATAIKYQASNDLGQVVDSTITATVGAPPAPTAAPDSSASAMRVVQTVNPLSNDTSGAAGIPLVATSVKLCGIDPIETPNNCTQTTLSVAGKGNFSVDTQTGFVSFTPIDTFHGTVPPVNYIVADTLGRVTTSQINIVVLPPPAMAAITDLSTGDYNTAQTISPLTNDSAGDLTAPELAAYTSKGEVAEDPTSVRFCAIDDPTTSGTNEAQSSPGCTATTITTTAGVYVVNPSTGVVTFTPSATFTGTEPNPPTYQTCNDVTGNWQPGTPPDTCASALIIPTVGAPPAPVAQPDSSSGNYDVNQVINPLTNDSLAANTNPNFPLDATTVKLCGAGETSPNCTKTTLTVLNEGTYTVNPITGVVTFDPLPAFTGTATPISYQVTDSLGRTVGSTITATVGPPPVPVANPDSQTQPYNINQLYSPAANDTANVNFALDATSVKLCGADDVSTSGINESVAPNCVANIL